MDGKTTQRTKSTQTESEELPVFGTVTKRVSLHLNCFNRFDFQTDLLIFTLREVIQMRACSTKGVVGKVSLKCDSWKKGTCEIDIFKGDFRRLFADYNSKSKHGKTKNPKMIQKSISKKEQI